MNGSTNILMLISVWALPLLIAITFHEAAHGFAARLFGDNTAYLLGRVSLNPLKHIDPFGTVLLPGMLLLTHSPFLFGYAKPVPVKFSALRRPRLGMACVAAAGGPWSRASVGRWSSLRGAGAGTLPPAKRLADLHLATRSD